MHHPADADRASALRDRTGPVDDWVLLRRTDHPSGPRLRIYATGHAEGDMFVFTRVDPPGDDSPDLANDRPEAAQ